MSAPRRRSRSGWFFAGGLAVVLVIGVIAVALSRDDGGDRESADAGGTEVAASVSLDGQSLPALTATGEDAAVGQTAPVARGEDFAGNPVSLAEGERPQLVVFLAHWCPHCRAEVPRIVELDEAGGFPTALEVVAVATGTSSDRDNFPPSAWLEREGWQSPVLVDTANGSVANAYGLSAYPFFVLLDARGEVLARDSGELTEEQLRGLMALALASMDDGEEQEEQEEGEEGPPATAGPSPP